MHLRRLLMCCAMALLMARSASAQQPVFLTDNKGAQFHGSLLELGPGTVAILVNGQRTDLALDSLVRIEAPGDSVKNGAIIGAVIYGGLCALICGQGLDRAGDLFVVVAVNTGIGALMGAGIDALHVGRTTIFRRDNGGRSGSAANARAALALRYRF